MPPEEEGPMDPSVKCHYENRVSFTHSPAQLCSGAELGKDTVGHCFPNLQMNNGGSTKVV